MQKAAEEKSKYHYMNMYVGCIHETWWEAVKDAVLDFIHYPKCRTWRIFRIKRGNY